MPSDRAFLAGDRKATKTETCFPKLRSVPNDAFAADDEPNLDSLSIPFDSIFSECA